MAPVKSKEQSAAMECQGVLVEMDIRVLAEVHARESSLQEISPQQTTQAFSEIVTGHDLV